MEKDKDCTKITKLQISSQFKPDDELYFLNDRYVLHGEIIGFKGTLDGYNEKKWLKILVTHNDLGAEFWVEEENCFKSKEDLIKSL